MTNLPPPDPRSSPIGFDEVIGIIVALTTIGAILFLTLGQKDKGFSFSRLLNPPATDKTATATGESAPPAPLAAVTPKVMSTSTPQAIAPSSAPEEMAPDPYPLSQTSPPAEPTIIAVPAPIPNQRPKSIPLAPVQLTPKADQLPPKSPAATVQTLKFKDVPPNFWARPYIDALTAQGLMSGFPGDTFQPNSSITRAQFAALLQKAFKQESKFKEQNFKDVDAKFWASPAIQQSVKTGFLRGYPNKIFLPQEKIPRVQVLVALVNGLKLTSTSASQAVLQTYQDASQIPNYAKGPVSKATQAGLVVNHPDPKLLEPNRNATRAEVAALVYRALVKAGKAKEIPSQYDVKP